MSTIILVKKWWNNLPIQNLHNPDHSWAGYVTKYYPQRPDCYHLTDEELLFMWNEEQETLKNEAEQASMESNQNLEQ